MFITISFDACRRPRSLGLLYYYCFTCRWLMLHRISLYYYPLSRHNHISFFSSLQPELSSPFVAHEDISSSIKSFWHHRGTLSPLHSRSCELTESVQRSNPGHSEAGTDTLTRSQYRHPGRYEYHSRCFEPCLLKKGGHCGVIDALMFMTPDPWSWGSPSHAG